MKASTEREIDAAFELASQNQANALIITADPFFSNRRDQIVKLAARHAIPTIYPWREYVAAGGLMSYGPNLADAFRQVGSYVGRLLKGAKPAELPVIQSSKFEFVINAETARLFGITVPPRLLASADEVIE